jgi:cyanophycinase
MCVMTPSFQRVGSSALQTLSRLCAVTALSVAWASVVSAQGVPRPTASAPASAAASAASMSPEYGPANGTLVIVGGGSTDSTGIVEKFVELAGGPNAKIVVVPTAGGNRRADGTPIAYVDSVVLASWKARGLTNVHMLHTHDPQVANTEAFAAVLKDANAVWFVGGRQWNIVDSYAKTRTYDAFHAVLARGGVIGGSSAGATIQGTYLVRGAVAGAQIMMAPEPEHQDGFNFLRRSAIDQHINTRNRWNDLQQVMAKFPNLLGIGISEGTAIVVRGDRFEVIGKAQVAIHDTTNPRPAGEKPYLTLQAGDRYDMKARQVIK